MSKPVNPYTRLVQEARAWVSKVMHPQRRIMFRYKKADLGNGWSFEIIAAKVLTAGHLGWRTEIEIEYSTGDLLIVHYQIQPNPPDALY